MTEFAYDADETRVRKSTAGGAETLYFGTLYERFTDPAAPSAEHRYHVHGPERAVAIVTRGGADPGTRYLHVDNLGSVEAVTDEQANLVEKRSYDPFGARRHPEWGNASPPPAATTTVGFTGHESDDDLGLVNAKGRIYDPKTARFLTPDPLVSRPGSGQAWNRYAYVVNNPLKYTDPSGFEHWTPDCVWGGSCEQTRAPPPRPAGNGPEKGDKGQEKTEDVSQSIVAGAAKPAQDVSPMGTGAPNAAPVSDVNYYCRSTTTIFAGLSHVLSRPSAPIFTAL